MRGKKARLLRKQSGFVPKDDREYSIQRNDIILNEGTAIPRINVRCCTISRLEYQYNKKDYKNGKRN